MVCCTKFIVFFVGTSESPADIPRLTNEGTITAGRGCIIASLRGHPHLSPSLSSLPVKQEQSFCSYRRDHIALNIIGKLAYALQQIAIQNRGYVSRGCSFEYCNGPLS